MGFFGNFRRKIKRKIIIIPLVGAMFLQAYAVGRPKFERILLIGNPAKAVYAVAQNQNIIDPYTFKIVDKEKKISVVDITHKYDVSSFFAFEYAPSYKEIKYRGDAGHRTVEEQTEEIRKVLESHIISQIEKKTGNKVDKKMLSKYLEHSFDGKIAVNGRIVGRSCPMGDPDKNVALAEKRAEESRRRLEETLKRNVIDSLGLSSKWSMKTTVSGEVSYENPLVEKGIKTINSVLLTNIDYNKIRKGDRQEIALLNAALRRAKSARYGHGSLFEYIKDLLAPRRGAMIMIEIRVEGKIIGILISLVEYIEKEKAVLNEDAEEEIIRVINKIIGRLDETGADLPLRETIRKIRKNIPRTPKRSRGGPAPKGNEFVKL